MRILTRLVSRIDGQFNIEPVEKDEKKTIQTEREIGLNVKKLAPIV